MNNELRIYEIIHSNKVESWWECDETRVNSFLVRFLELYFDFLHIKIAVFHCIFQAE